MRGRLYLDTMHANRANLIMRYILIQRSDLKTRHTIVIVRISRLFLWYAMNELMHVMQSWFLRYMDDHFSHFPWLNHECKIECLHLLDLPLLASPRVGFSRLVKMVGWGWGEILDPHHGAGRGGDGFTLFRPTLLRLALIRVKL